MSNKEITVKEKIILSTIDCIEEQGIHSITIRKIAKKANVNSAAINYYFGSKDNLIDKVLKHTLYTAFTENLDELEKKLQKDPSDKYEILRGFFIELLNGIFRYPGLTKAHFYNPFIDRNYSGLLLNEFNNFLVNLSKTIEPMLCKEEQKNMTIIVTSLLSSVLFPGMFPSLIDQFLDLTNKKGQEKYIDTLLKKFFE